jgi:DNA-directed RNA polymerase specialized sigma24 family protein
LSRDLARRIQRAIGRLAPKLKDTFLLATSGEHTYDEIAQMLKIPTGTVKWRVAEARRIIGRSLQGRKAASR